MMKRSAAWTVGRVVVGASVLMLGLGGCRSDGGAGRETPAAVAPAPMTETQRQLQLESFDKVWETIRDRHWDPSLNGADWAAAREELRPRVQAATTVNEARGVIDELLGRLKQTHFGLIPSDTYDRLDDRRAGSDANSGADSGADRDGGWTGITARLVDGRALVTQVREGSPAHQAGVRAGWVVRAVDGRRFDGDLNQAAQSFGSPALGLALAARAVEGALAGPVGSEADVELLNGQDRVVNLKIKRAEAPGNLASFGNLPAMRVEFESKRLESNIGYVRLSVFLDVPRVMPAFAAAMKELQGCDGLIIDLRGNPGGLGIMAIGMGGYFVDEPNLKLGVMTTREGTLNFVLNPRTPRWEKKVAILVDEASLSTSEILAGGLQDLGKARVFGSATGGAALPSQIIRLPSGDALQFAVANYVSVSGRTLEGAGVLPDEVVPLERRVLLAGRDPVMEAAVGWIRGGSNRY